MYGHPLGGRRVSARHRLGQPGSDGEVGDRDYSSAGIAAGLSVGAELLQVQSGAVEIRFFPEFTVGRAEKVLLWIVEESARQSPHSPVRLNAPLDEQNLQFRLPKRQDHEVDRD
ncbi:hypothetical protein FHU38_002921 [Saccharomonospora amisosensis]|uniref:Uncharacterized protein n=1 Tax=Saccharomonospora amisosensis TaxID=1128677 RepID=A0A7X5URJ6_9PSEU|nr:hypothetical protein [Saccharomonospora amisosensis]